MPPPPRPFYLAAHLQGRPFRRDWQFTPPLAGGEMYSVH